MAARALTAILAIALVALSVAEAAQSGRPAVAFAGLLLALLAWLTTVHLLAGGVVVGCVLTGLLLLPPDMAGFAVHGALIPVAVAGYAGRGRVAVALAAWYTAALTLDIWRGALGSNVADVVPYGGIWTALFVFAWVLGEWLRRGRLAAEAQRQLALDEQRRLIARELHDNVAHALTMLVLRSESARHQGAGVLDADEVETACRLALADLRRMLEVLRSESVEGMSSSIATSLDEVVTAAVERLEGAGFAVRTSVAEAGTIRDVMVGSVVAAVMREAASNVIRHGSPEQPCHLMVDVSDARLEVVLLNTPAPGAAPSGPTPLGVTGMRERLERVGGTLDARMGASQWMLRIMLPLDPATTTPSRSR